MILWIRSIHDTFMFDMESVGMLAVLIMVLCKSAKQLWGIEEIKIAICPILICLRRGELKFLPLSLDKVPISACHIYQIN